MILLSPSFTISLIYDLNASAKSINLFLNLNGCQWHAMEL